MIETYFGKKNRLYRLLTWLFLSIVTFLLIIQVNAQTDDIVITVDAETEVGEISPYIYGLNHGPWSEVSLQMQEESRELEMNFLRYPGGNWGDQFDLTEPQIDLYIAQSRMWNAEPSIHVRLEGGTPEQAAELVRYTNIENDYNVRYWYIGNEPNLFDDYSVEQFNTEWRAIALAMLEVDPDIILIGPEVSQFPDTLSESDPNYALNNEWLRQFLIENGDLVDIVSVHRYPFPVEFAGDPTTIEAMRLNVPRWQTVVLNIRNTIDEIIGEDMPIALTEVNSHWSNSGGGVASPDSYFNAVWWSGVLTTLIHEEVDIVTYFILSSVGANGPFGLLDRYNPRPTYYTYLLYRELGETRLQSESSDEYVTAVATRHEVGTHSLIVTNLYDEDLSVTLDLNGFDELSVSRIQLLSPDVMAESVPVEDYLNEESLSIPAQSVILLVFE